MKNPRLGPSSGRARRLPAGVLVHSDSYSEVNVA